MCPSLTRLFLLLSLTSVLVHCAFRKLGDDVVLHSGSGATHITSITWRHGIDIAAVWYGDETYYYKHFKGHCTLDTSNGVLTIKGLTRNDTGNYTAEINNSVANRTEILVISPVQTPTVSSWCDPDKTYCVLACEGGTADAEPVTYSWKSGDMILPSTKELNITEEMKEPWFSCMLGNPVSQESSEHVLNPFSSGNRTLSFIPLVVVGGMVVLVLCALSLRSKCKGGNSLTGTREDLSIQETSGEHLISSVHPDTIDKPVDKNLNHDDSTVISSNMSDDLEPPAPVPTPPASPGSSNETVRTVSEPQEPPTQDLTSVAPPDTSGEPGRSAMGLEDQETSNSDLETAASPDACDEAEAPGGEETPGPAPRAEEQAADEDQN